MTRNKTRETADYVYNTPKKPTVPPSRRKVIKSKMIGNTLVRRIIDEDYEPPLVDLQGFSIL
jgi:hypothetical protein